MDTTLGSVLRAERLKRGWTLDELAARSGLSKGFLSLLENGKTRLGRLDKASGLADALEIPLEQLGRLAARGGGERPGWLEHLVAKYDLHPEAQVALLQVAEERAAYRSVAGTAASESTANQRWEKFYLSVKPFLPKPMTDRLVNDSRVRDVARELLGVGGEFAWSLETLLSAVDRRVEKLVGIVSSVDELRSRLSSALQVEVVYIDTMGDIEAVKHRLAQYGLLRAIGELAFFEEDETLLGGTYPVRAGLAPCCFVIMIDRHTAHKRSRADFTLWHELAHVLCDPGIERGSVTVDDGSCAEGGQESPAGGAKEPIEWLMDKIAARLAFYPKLLECEVQRVWHESGGALSLDAVESFRDRFNTEASRQMSAWALTDAWPGPVAYLEAELRNRKGCSGAKQLRVAYLHANAAARKAGVVFGPNMRVPQESVMGRCFDSLVPSGMDGEARNQAGSRKEGDEELSTWTYSDGGRLNTCRVHVRAEARLERGQARVYAFVSPVSPVSPVRAAPATQTGD